MKLMSVAALLLSTAPAMAGEVLMLEHNPSVEELRGYLTPDSPRRTRGIEIMTQPAAPAMPTTKAAATMDAPEPAAPAPAPEPTTIGYHIQFAYDSADIQAESRSFLDQLGQVLQSEPKLALAVEGHTDAHGSAGYNLGLSQRRAAAVQSYLSTVWNIPAERLTVSGKGESEPLAPDGNAAENRRVQFRPLS